MALRLPKIMGASEREQIAEIKSYLYYLVEELEYSLNNKDAGKSGSATGSAVSTASQAYATFESIKPYILKSEDIVTAFGDIISEKEGGAWTDLKLLQELSEVAIGRTETGCFYRVCDGGKHVYISFNCSFAYEDEALKVNKTLIPEEYRPKRDIFALCPTGDGSFARVIAGTDGQVLIDSAQSPTVDWIDGYIDYWIEVEKEND